MNSTTRNERAAAAVVADPRWARVLARDASADGSFVFSVSTTGVYCRPACTARRPRPENVGFHRTAADAERAGFRPCKRCKPDQPPLAAQRASVVAELCRLIDGCDGRVAALAELARHTGWSAHHLQRVFKSATGLTPRQFAAARRAEILRDELCRAGSVTDAIYAAGYGSSSRFYERCDGVLGMTPSRFRAGGADTRIRFAIGQCSLGAVLVALSERGVCAILLGDDPQRLAQQLQDRFANAELIADDAGFDDLVARVVGLVEAPSRGIELPLDLRGTVFQRRVWQALQSIPAGQTASYADIAARIGAPAAVRAVAGACAANLVAVAVPCHRVVRSDGNLAGYRWGVERKQALLERESRP